MALEQRGPEHQFLHSIKVRPLYNKNFLSLPLPMQPQWAAQERENKSSLCIKSLSASGWRRQLDHWKSAVEVGNSRFWRWRNFGKNLQGLPTFTSIQVRCLINHHNASCLVSMSIAFKCISSSRYSGALQAPAASKASLASRKLAGTDLPHGISSDLIKSQASQGDCNSPSLVGLPSQLNTIKGCQCFDLDLDCPFFTSCNGTSTNIWQQKQSTRIVNQPVASL